MLRKPIGNYNVGITRYQTNEFGTSDNVRKVSCTIYYPSNETGEEAPYANVDYIYGKKECVCANNGVRTFCYEKVPLMLSETKYRVILFSHGLNGHEMECTVLCADLASFGYVVVSVGHPIGSPIIAYEDGSFHEWKLSENISKEQLKGLLTLWKEDFERVMEQLEELPFANQLLLTEFDLLGMSLGGNAAILTGLTDTQKRIRHVVNLDGRLFVLPDSIYHQPEIMVYCGKFSLLSYLDLKKIHYEKLQIVKRKGLNHYHFSDGLFLSDKGKEKPDWADCERMNRTMSIKGFLEAVSIK